MLLFNQRVVKWILEEVDEHEVELEQGLSSPAQKKIKTKSFFEDEDDELPAQCLRLQEDQSRSEEGRNVDFPRPGHPVPA